MACPLRAGAPTTVPRATRAVTASSGESISPPCHAGTSWRFNQFFVNGQRRPRARTPNQREFLRTEGPVTKGDRRSFFHQRALSQAEIQASYQKEKSRRGSMAYEVVE